MKKTKLYYHLVEYRRRTPPEGYIWQKGYEHLATFDNATAFETWVRQNPDFCGWVVPSRDPEPVWEEEIGGYDAVGYNGTWTLGYMMPGPIWKGEVSNELP